MPKVSRSRHEAASAETGKVDRVLKDLWRSPYQQGVRKAVGQIGSFYLHARTHNKIWRPSDMRPIVDQYIFGAGRLVNHDGDSRASMYKVFRPTWEIHPVRVLQTAQVLLRSITASPEEMDQQHLFDTYFQRRNYEEVDFPLSVLTLMSQLSVGIKNIIFLRCCAKWMKEMGLESFASTHIAKEIVKDFSQADSADKYFKLPEFAPEFTATLVMTIAKLYRDRDRPEVLVNQISVWLECHPTVCFTPPQSSIFELYRWSMPVVSPEPRLHAAVLSAIHRVGRGVQLQVIPHIMQIIQELKQRRDMYCQKHDLTSLSKRYLKRKRNADIDNGVDSARAAYARDLHMRNTLKVQICRLFQIIQMLISAGCLEDNEIPPIFQAYEASLEFKFNFYLQLKSIYGIHEDAAFDDNNSQTCDSALPPRKQMYGKYGHHLKNTTAKNKRLQLNQKKVSSYSITQLPSGLTYMNSSGEPKRYTIESDSSDNEWDDFHGGKFLGNGSRSASSPSNHVERIDFSVDQLIGHNGRLK